MNRYRMLGVSAAGIMSVAALVLVSALITMLVSDPVQVAGALATGDVDELFRELVKVLAIATRAALRWL